MNSQWAEFLVGDTDALPLRVFEVLFTSSFLLWMGRCFVTWEEWLTDRGFHLNAAELTALGYPLPLDLMTGPWVICLSVIIGISGMAHICNRHRRLALATLFACAVYVQGADLMAAFTLNKLFVGIYGILFVTPGFRRDQKTGHLLVSALPVRVIQATLILQYFAAGLAKAFRGDWLKYSDVLYTQVQGMYRTDFAAWLLRVLPVWAWTMMQWTSLLFELEAPLLFCWRKVRPVMFVLGIGFHFVIALVMKDLIFFTLQMWSFYALFISAEEWRTLAIWVVTAKERIVLRSPIWSNRPVNATKTVIVSANATIRGEHTPAFVESSPCTGYDQPGQLAITIARAKASGFPSRRLFLTAAGVTLAVPLLESVSERLLKGRAGIVVKDRPAKSDRLTRMVCIGNAFGFYQPAFWPQQSGRKYDLPLLLKPLASYVGDLTLFSGLDHGHKGGHWAINSYLSGVRSMEAKFMPDKNITIDQRAAESIAGATRFPSLAVGSLGGLVGGCMMSWTRAGTRVPPIPSPKELFNKLFVSDTANDRNRNLDVLDLQGSILDTVRGNAKLLERGLGKRDREKLDEYFTSLRDVEKQIELNKRWADVPKPSPKGFKEPEDKGLVSDLPAIYDLIALALQTDSARIATLEIGGGFETSPFGLRRDYHGLSHHGQVQENIDGLLKVESYQMEQFARFLGKLKSINDGDGSLLDHTMVLFGSGMANANAHTNLNLPIILSGGGFNHGEHKRYPTSGLNKQPLCNLYVTMLQRFGLDVDRFGTGRGTLAGFA